MAKRKSSGGKSGPGPAPTELRIIGGSFRGRALAYSGDARTRPMKDRVRESAFNLLAGRFKGHVALDLFAGTGALGLEALSRGAARAIFLERHYPTARLIEANLRTLGAEERGTVVAADTFFWIRHDWQPGAEPLLVFCSPPYDFYVQRKADMVALIQRILEQAPAGSTLVVESDERFDIASVSDPEGWFVRAYPPAVLAIMST